MVYIASNLEASHSVSKHSYSWMEATPNEQTVYTVIRFTVESVSNASKLLAGHNSAWHRINHSLDRHPQSSCTPSYSTETWIFVCDHTFDEQYWVSIYFPASMVHIESQTWLLMSSNSRWGCTRWLQWVSNHLWIMTFSYIIHTTHQEHAEVHVCNHTVSCKWWEW